VPVEVQAYLYSCLEPQCRGYFVPLVIPRRPQDFKWQPSAPVYNRRYGPPTAVTWQQAPCIRGQVSTHWPLLQRVESTDHLVHRQWTGGILLAFWLPMCEVCTPSLLRLQKHTKLRARALSHLWHEHRLTNCSYAWSRGLCGITRTVPSFVLVSGNDTVDLSGRDPLNYFPSSFNIVRCNMWACGFNTNNVNWHYRQNNSNS